jgi:hypothetical protein
MLAASQLRISMSARLAVKGAATPLVFLDGKALQSCCSLL